MFGKEEWAWIFLLNEKALRSQQELPREPMHKRFMAQCVKSDLPDCFKGKLAKILDVESMGFSSNSQKKNLTE